MEINPSEVTKILKEQIKNFGDKAEVTEVGQVEQQKWFVMVIHEEEHDQVLRVVKDSVKQKLEFKKVTKHSMFALV